MDIPKVPSNINKPTPITRFRERSVADRMIESIEEGVRSIILCIRPIVNRLITSMHNDGGPERRSNGPSMANVTKKRGFSVGRIHALREARYPTPGVPLRHSLEDRW